MSPLGATLSARTQPDTAGRKVLIGLHVVRSIAATFCTPMPFTALNNPAAYSVCLSGETPRARTDELVPVNDSWQPRGTPVAASRATKLLAADSLTPAADPDGRTALKVPPT